MDSEADRLNDSVAHEVLCCAFEVGNRYRLGQLTQVRDDLLRSSSRVQDRQITQVNRQMGNRRFSVLIQERITVGNGRCLTVYAPVISWDLDPTYGAPGDHADNDIA